MKRSPLRLGCLPVRCGAFEQPQHFTGLRVSLEPGFLEHRRAIARHFESAALRRLQLDLGVRIPLTNLRRQTGGAWFVVSQRAILDGDSHQSLEDVGF